MREKKRCYAKAILGAEVSEGWIESCPKRAKGLCCRDCPAKDKCSFVCARIKEELEKNIPCPFYTTKLDAFSKRLAIEAGNFEFLGERDARRIKRKTS